MRIASSCNHFLMKGVYRREVLAGIREIITFDQAIGLITEQHEERYTRSTVVPVVAR